MAGTDNLNVGQHVVQFYGHDQELAERVARCTAWGRWLRWPAGGG